MHSIKGSNPFSSQISQGLRSPAGQIASGGQSSTQRAAQASSNPFASSGFPPPKANLNAPRPVEGVGGKLSMMG